MRLPARLHITNRLAAAAEKPGQGHLGGPCSRPLMVYENFSAPKDACAPEPIASMVTHGSYG
jgi:hypothetical protein